jgi:dolichol-phosphate mannosyltransferase
MARISIVVPVYQNASSLPDLLARLRHLADRHPSDSFEFVCVDDGSRDDSYAVLRKLTAAEPRLRVARLSRNFGSSAAILAGLSLADGDAVAALAADLQDPPELLDEMLARWRSGRRVVLAARAGRDDPYLTTLFARVFYALFRRWALPTMPHGGFDFFLIDRRVSELIRAMPEKNSYLMGLILWVGFSPDVVHYRRLRREARYGRSMWTLAKKLTYFADCFTSFSYVPVRLASLLGFGLGLLGLVYAVAIVALRIAYGTTVEGWSSLMVVVLWVSGTQLVMTGVLGEYIWRGLEEIRGRPRFVIDELVEADALRVSVRSPADANLCARLSGARPSRGRSPSEEMVPAASAETSACLATAGDHAA